MNLSANQALDVSYVARAGLTEDPGTTDTNTMEKQLKKMRVKILTRMTHREGIGVTQDDPGHAYKPDAINSPDAGVRLRRIQ